MHKKFLRTLIICSTSLVSMVVSNSGYCMYTEEEQKRAKALGIHVNQLPEARERLAAQRNRNESKSSTVKKELHANSPELVGKDKETQARLLGLKQNTNGSALWLNEKGDHYYWDVFNERFSWDIYPGGN